MHLKIAERQNGDVTILDLEGRLVLGEEADALRDHVERLLEAQRNKIVVLLEKVIRVDSAGWGTMMGALRSARNTGGDLRLLQPSKAVRELMDLFGLKLRPDLVRIFVDEQEAVQSFSARGGSA